MKVAISEAQGWPLVGWPDHRGVARGRLLSYLIKMLGIVLASPAAMAADFTAVAAHVGPSVVTIEVRLAGGGRAAGSGFVVGDGTQLATNYHVMEDASEVYCTFTDGTVERATGWLATEPSADLAVLKLPSKHTALGLAGSTIPAGSPVLAVGNPIDLGLSYSDGIVSGARKLEGVILLQHTAPISPGNSGGPLVSTTGEVIGVNTFYIVADAGQNLNFAVSSMHVLSLLERAQGSVHAFEPAGREERALAHAATAAPSPPPKSRAFPPGYRPNAFQIWSACRESRDCTVMLGGSDFLLPINHQGAFWYDLNEDLVPRSSVYQAAGCTDATKRRHSELHRNSALALIGGSLATVAGWALAVDGINRQNRDIADPVAYAEIGTGLVAGLSGPFVLFAGSGPDQIRSEVELDLARCTAGGFEDRWRPD